MNRPRAAGRAVAVADPSHGVDSPTCGYRRCTFWPGTVRATVPALAAPAGASEVWLFGSLVGPPEWAEPHERSDIDLAIAGLDAAAFGRLAGDLFAALPVPADVVHLERADATLRERILAHGERVYARGANAKSDAGSAP